jgi:ATP synthase protein I
MPDKQEERKFSRTIEEKQERKLAARRNADRTVWFGLGMFGLVGWSVAIPTLIGTFTGLWLDRTWPGRPSWTLTLLITGVAVGCWNAWYWIKRESRKKE